MAYVSAVIYCPRQAARDGWGMTAASVGLRAPRTPFHASQNPLLDAHTQRCGRLRWMEVQATGAWDHKAQCAGL